MENTHDPDVSTGIPGPDSAAPPLVPPIAPPAAASFPPPVATTALPSTGAPSYSPAPSGSESGSGKKMAIIVSIIVGVILLLVGLGVALYFVAQSALSTLENEIGGIVDESYPEIEPLVRGDAGPATATSPLACPEQCFTEDALGSVYLDAPVFSALGIPSELPWEEGNSSADQEFFYSAGNWTSGGGAPDECFITGQLSPIALPIDGRPESGTDPIGFGSEWSSDGEYSLLSQSTRLFSSSAAAEQHMGAVLAMVPLCETYAVGEGEGRWAATVTPMPALELPDSVAAVGWVEDAVYARFYVADLQRGNVVYRASLYTDGEVTEEAFRDFVIGAAAHIASLTP